MLWQTRWDCHVFTLLHFRDNKNEQDKTKEKYAWLWKRQANWLINQILYHSKAFRISCPFFSEQWNTNESQASRLCAGSCLEVYQTELHFWGSTKLDKQSIEASVTLTRYYWRGNFQYNFCDNLTGMKGTWILQTASLASIALLGFKTIITNWLPITGKRGNAGQIANLDVMNVCYADSFSHYYKLLLYQTFTVLNW